MTLTDVLQALTVDTADTMEKSPEMTTCDLVSTAITQAAREGRLIHGLSDCVTALSRNPSDVVICILPVDSAGSDINRNIQTLLIESVCVEYDILILKMDSAIMHSGMTSPSGSSDLAAFKFFSGDAASSELDCFLIQHGDDGLSCSDKKLLHMFQDMWNDGAQVKGFEEFPE